MRRYFLFDTRAFMAERVLLWILAAAFLLGALVGWAIYEWIWLITGVVL